MKEAEVYPNSAWRWAFVGGSYQFLAQEGVRNLDARTAFIYYATGITPAMTLKMGRPRLAIHWSVHGCRRQAAGWQQDLQNASAAERAGQELLVLRRL
jgi:hypothetical protein